MRTKQLAASLIVLALAGAYASSGGASAATPGVGTASEATTILSIALGKSGSLLNIQALSDTSRSTINPQVATPSQAFTRLSPLSISSSVIPALNVSVPAVESYSTGSPQTLSVPTVGVPAAVPAAVATGSVSPGTLTAAVDSTGAHASLSSTIKNLTLAGGALLSVPNVSSDLSTAAASANSDGLRGVTVDEVSALKLGALLKGLGIDLTSLPLSTITGLVGQLGATIASVASPSALAAQLTTLNTAIQQATASIGTATGSTPINGTPVSGTVNSTISSVLGSGAPTLTTGTTTATQALGVVSQLTTQLQGLLNSTLAALDSAPLLDVQGIQIGLTAKAADTLANSVAAVTGKIGSVKVGSLTLPGVDLASAAASVSGLVSAVTSKVQAVLGTISPDLANLVSVKVLAQNTSLTSTNGVTRALAGLTALSATITPPANLASLVSSLANTPASASPVGAILGTAAAPLASSGAAGLLNSALGVTSSALGALAGGATVTVASLQATSDFTPALVASPQPAAPAAVPPKAALPRTGGDSGPLAVVAVLLLVTAAGLIRWLRRPLPAS